MQAGSNAELNTELEELVKKAQEGHAASFAALYEHFFDKIFRYVSFKTGSAVEAEDIAGDVFVKMLESINSFKWQGYPFSSWLFRIAHNMIVDYFRKKSRKKTVPIDAASSLAGASTPADLDGRIDLDLKMVEVKEAMRNLTKLQQEVISLRFAAGLTVSETAHAVGKKENAVKALQHAGLKKLKRSLNPQPGQTRHTIEPSGV